MPHKILIVKPSALGDIVHSLPFLAALTDRYPEAEVHWVVAEGLHSFLEGHPLIARLWIMRKDSWKRLGRGAQSLREMRDLARGLGAEGFDLAVDLQGLLRSGLVTRASRAPMRVGFKEAREGSRLFYTHAVSGGRDVHAITRQMRIAEFLGCPTAEIRYPFPPLPAPPEGLPSRYAVIAPSAGKEANRWPAERFGALCARLPMPTVVISGPKDAHVAQAVAAASCGNAVSLAGRTSLKEMAAIVKGASFMVSNDTGPMHIAAAFGVPVFAIFGPANPARTGPYGDIHTVIRADADCAPCYRKRKCRDWKCLESLTVDRVLEAILGRFWNSVSRSNKK